MNVVSIPMVLHNFSLCYVDCWLLFRIITIEKLGFHKMSPNY